MFTDHHSSGWKLHWHNRYCFDSRERVLSMSFVNTGAILRLVYAVCKAEKIGCSKDMQPDSVRDFWSQAAVWELPQLGTDFQRI